MDRLRLEIASAAADAGGGFEVKVYVNDVEMTEIGAGMGMDPSDLLFPQNKLRPTTPPSVVPIARCDCGVYGCGATDVRVVDRGDSVRWEWLVEAPINRACTFSRDEYFEEMSRFESDHSWETPERTLVRLIDTAVRRDHLRAQGLQYSWSGNHHTHPGTFRICFAYRGKYQIFVNVPWRGRRPAELALHIRSTLDGTPDTWPAQWHPIDGTSSPPDIAGSDWRRLRFSWST